MKHLIVILVSLISSAAFADGWQCKAQDGSLNVAVYNQTSQGTRTAAIMILSNPSVQYGRKTIATFRHTEGQLVNEGTQYFAFNDTAFGEQGGGEYIAGTRLGYVDRLGLFVNFSYNAPVEAGAVRKGLFVLLKNNQQVATKIMYCSRYLKGEQLN